MLSNKTFLYFFKYSVTISIMLQFLHSPAQTTDSLNNELFNHQKIKEYIYVVSPDLSNIYQQLYDWKEVLVEDSLHSPKVATFMSMALPGLGQVYNRKYWKLPIIYGGIGVLCYFGNMNHKEYIKYRDEYEARAKGDTLSDIYLIYSTDDLKELKNSYKRNLDLTYILAGFLYILNVVDAAVDANLYDFDVSNNLSLKIEPVINNNYYINSASAGIKLTLKL